MINIDKIEKMEIFPNFINYVFLSIREGFTFIFLFLFFSFMFFSKIIILVGVIGFTFFSVMSYKMDKRLFKDLKHLKKSDS